MRVVFIHPHANNLKVASVRVNALIPANTITNKGEAEAFVVSSFREALNFQPDVAVCFAEKDAREVFRFRNNNPLLGVVVFQSDGPEMLDAWRNADAIVTDSVLLLTKIPSVYRKKTFSINDALEVNVSPPKTHPGRELKLGWVGAGGNYFFAEEVVVFLKRLGWSVTVVSDDVRVADVEWSVEASERALSACDVGLVPYPPNLSVPDTKTFTEFLYKDNCRSILFQALGLPVICSPHPAILQYIEHNKTGLIANRLSDWINCLNSLQLDHELYNSVAVEGNKQAWSLSHPDVVAEEWLRVIKLVEVSRVHGKSARPVVA